ncbi:hypothetical protein [Geomicrobium sp. JCM 19037]|nr:hypothetical protein [Geomicrobium sp. JCM 19037]
MDLINMELLQTTLIIASFLAIILFFSNLFDVFNEKIMGRFTSGW